MENLKKAMIIRNGNVVGAVGDKNFSTAPIGTVLAYAGNEAPRGYLLADGASYPTTEYPDLYAVIGNTYGGDSTNFNVPDYRETVLVGVGENTTDTIVDHDVYELGEFKDDQMQSHTHDVKIPNSVAGSWSVNSTGSAYYSSGIKTQTSTVSGTGTTTHGKQKGVTYIIKAFHTNEGTDSGVSDDVIEYVDNKVATKKDAVKLLNNATDSTKWLKLKLGNPSTFQPIIVSDQYGGKVEITGMADDGTYKPVKLVRYSYGDWTTYSATDYTLYNGVDPNYKIQRFYYYPTDGYYYLEIRQWVTIKVEGNSAAELVTSLPAEKSEMTLIPESRFASKSEATKKKQVMRLPFTISDNKFNVKYSDVLALIDKYCNFEDSGVKQNAYIPIYLSCYTSNNNTLLSCFTKFEGGIYLDRVMSSSNESPAKITRESEVNSISIELGGNPTSLFVTI